MIQRRQQPKELLDRMPPADTDAERSVLGSILLKPDVIDDVATLVEPADFYDQAHGTLYRHLRDMQHAGERIDVALLTARLKDKGDLEPIGGTAYLYKIGQCVPNAAHAVYYAKIVREKAIRRRVLDAAQQMMQDAHDCSETDAAEVLARSEARVLEIGQQHVGAEHSHTAKDMMFHAADRLERRRRGEMTSGLATGYAALDSMTGGLRPGEVTILAGRTSMGKTALACNILEHVVISEGKPALLVSLEMSEAEVSDRLLCSVARVDSQRVRKGDYSDEDGRHLAEASAKIGESRLMVDDRPGRSAMEIAALARRQKRRSGLELLVIDYLQLVTPDNPRDPRQDQVARISRSLKGLARELQVPVICLAQLNRKNEATESKRPTLSCLRESGAIEQDADVVLFVHRPAYYGDRPTPSGQGEEAEILVAKNRSGPTGMAKVMWFGAYCRFDNAAAEWERTQAYEESPAPTDRRGRRIREFDEYNQQ